MSGFEPEIGPDGRPRPRFGEYATAEEQRARIKDPSLLPGAQTQEEPGAASPEADRPAPPTPAVAARPPRFADRIATFVLLGYGLFNVLSTSQAALNYSSFVDSFLSVLGVQGALADPAGAQGWGIGAAAVMIVGWLATLALSMMSVRAGRVTFWIPLVAGLVCNLIASALLITPIVSDPALWSAVQSSSLF